MCDEVTEEENVAYLSAKRLNRRDLNLGAGATLAATLVGCSSAGERVKEPQGSSTAAPSASAQNPAPTSQGEAALAVTSQMVTVDTPDGSAEALFVAPAGGPHPGILLWPDIAGLRDAYKKMASRLAGAGYAVLAVNQYYRSSKLPILNSLSEWRKPESRERLRPMIDALTPEAATRDGAAFIKWLDNQENVSKEKKLGTMGYCMGGRFTFYTAAAVPERVGVLASFHGGGLVTDKPTSPHLLLPKMKAAALICIAQNDDARDPDAKVKLKAAAEQANVVAEIEVYPAQHGWCTIDAPIYDETQAEKAWARMLATYQRHLG